VTLAPTQVDVNVHPAKREVRFRRPRDVRESIISAISSALSPCRCERPQEPPFAPFSTTQIQPQNHEVLATENNISDPEEIKAELENAREVLTLAEPVTEIDRTETTEEFSHTSAENTEKARTQLDISLKSAYGPWAWFEYIGQTSKGYVILETDAGIVTLNPRAAMERIAYEKLLESSEVSSQQLLIPETIQLSPGNSARIKNFKSELEKIGFTIEEFGKDIWKVDAIPSILGNTPVSAILSSILCDITEGGTRRGQDRWKEELIAKSVAKSHAGAMPKLTKESAVDLVKKLAASRMPYTDPRNKPVMIFTSFRELERKFS
jgi:DNA mismatch repair protein MutL